MIQLFYTNAEQPNSSQENPSKSIGGYVSSTQVKNDELENLFGSVSQEREFRRNIEYRLLALKNLHTQSIENIKLIIGLTGNGESKFYLASSLPVDNTCEEKEFELLTSKYSKPSSVDSFLEIQDQQEVELTGVELESGEVVGFWLSREYIKEEVNLDCDNLNEDMSTGVITDNKIVKLNLTIDYELVPE